MTEAGARPRAHVVFPMDVDDGGWPPVGAERVWAFDLGEGLYEIDNVPWFVRDLAVGDVVRAAAADADSNPVFQEVVERSDHVTVRIIGFRSGPLAGDLQRVVDAFSPLGVYCEGASQYGMVAMDVPRDAQLQAIQALLASGTQDGSWEYDEGRITNEWTALSR